MFESFRVYLRALELNDYQKSIKWRRDDELWSMVSGPKYFVSEAYEKKWVEDRIFHNADRLTLSVCIKDTEEHIGYVYLNHIDWKNRKAAFAKLIGEKQFWGKGFAKEATLLMLYHGFYVLGLERIEATPLIDNQASLKTNEKCGFKREGVLRRAVYKYGEFKDVFIMSVIRKDFDSVIKNLIIKED